MRRTSNIESSVNSKQRNFHNPLFNMLTVAFDKFIVGSGLAEEELLELYVDDGNRKKLYDIFTQNVNENEKMHISTPMHHSGFVYLLHGKKGIGKTITLKTISSDIRENNKDKNDTYVIYLDLMTKKNDESFLKDTDLFISKLKKNSIPIESELLLNIFTKNTGLFVSIVEAIYDSINNDSHKKTMGNLSEYLTDINKMRELHPAFLHLGNERLVEVVLGDKAETVKKIFSLLSARKTKVYLIIDNIDDFPLSSVKNIIDICIKLSQDYKVRCIIGLRNYWNLKAMNINDTNISSFFLDTPNVLEIVKKRLKSIPIDNIKEGYEVTYRNRTISIEPKHIIDIFNSIVSTILNEKEHEKMYRLANSNIREHLFNIYYFFHSPYLYSNPIFNQHLLEKISQIDKAYDSVYDEYKEKPRKPQFFDLLESAMAIHTLFYDAKASKIFNIFFHTHEYNNIVYDYRNTLIYIRIMQAITRDIEDKENVIERLKLFGYTDEALRSAINILLEEALIESRQGCQEECIIDISKSEKGKLYLSELINEYTYLLFICDAVPMPDTYKKNIEEKFGSDDLPLGRGALSVKNDSVLSFIDFIEKEELSEEEACQKEQRPNLAQIRGENGISGQMKKNILVTIEKMIKHNRGAQRRSGIKITNIKK